MKHTLILEIESKKPLPPDTADQVAQRAYMFLYSHGCEVGVKATLLEPTQRDHGQGVA